LRRSTRAGGDIELAPPQYVTLLDLRQFASVGRRDAGDRRRRSIDYLPRFQFVTKSRCACIPKTSPTTISSVWMSGRRHRLYLRGDAWEYIRD